MAGEEPEVGLRSGTDLGTSRWLVMELEVGLRIGADLWTSRCIVQDLEMARSGTSLDNWIILTKKQTVQSYYYHNYKTER